MSEYLLNRRVESGGDDGCDVDGLSVWWYYKQRLYEVRVLLRRVVVIDAFLALILGSDYSITTDLHISRFVGRLIDRYLLHG